MDTKQLLAATTALFDRLDGVPCTHGPWNTHATIAHNALAEICATMAVDPDQNATPAIQRLLDRATRRTEMAERALTRRAVAPGA